MAEEEEDMNANLENGHYSSGPHTEASDSDESSRDGIDEELDQAQNESGNSSQFDTNLPTTHKYLGRLDNISGYTIFDDHQVIEMLAMYTQTMVFPGFTLPMMVRGDYHTSRLYEDFKNGYTFVLTCQNFEGTNMFEYGVVMEVFENSIKRGSVTLKAKGRQRCRILPGQVINPTWGRMTRVKVEILPEVALCNPLADTQLLSLKRSKRPSTVDYKDCKKNQKYSRYHLAQFPFPYWVYDQFELDYYVKRIIDGLSIYYLKENIPRDPLALSYWFVQNFQLTHVERLRILACHTTLERLQRELKYLKLERVICCGCCGINIASQNRVFAMSKDGVQSNYVNPGGVVYETVTVSAAVNFVLSGAPSRQFSWFPGYAWTIMNCKLCKAHLGWQFSSPNLNPPIFYGLGYSNLKMKIKESRPASQ